MTIPLVIAHRGSSAAHPGNTWGAFEAALTDSADAIECDVQLTCDAVLVVRHDLTQGGRLVRDLTSAAVVAGEPDTVELPALLHWATIKRLDVLVEIKEPDAAPAVVSAIRRCTSLDRVVVAGFHGPMLASIKTALPDLRTSFMIGSVVAVDELVHLARAYRADGVHLCWEHRAARPHRLVDAQIIDQLRRAALAVTLWHEEREDELPALVALEPDAICTNTPAVLRRIVDQRFAGGEARSTGPPRDSAGDQNPCM
jgi:glycerophosphoryl diester phosphodiesterase